MCATMDWHPACTSVSPTLYPRFLQAGISLYWKILHNSHSMNGMDSTSCWKHSRHVLTWLHRITAADLFFVNWRDKGNSHDALLVLRGPRNRSLHHYTTRSSLAISQEIRSSPTCSSGTISTHAKSLSHTIFCILMFAVNITSSY